MIVYSIMITAKLGLAVTVTILLHFLLYSILFEYVVIVSLQMLPSNTQLNKIDVFLKQMGRNNLFLFYIILEKFLKIRYFYIFVFFLSIFLDVSWHF